MVDSIVYHDSNGNTISMKTEDLTETYDFHGKNIYVKSNKGDSIVHDPNRVLRIFEWTTILSRADLDELKGYIQPATAPSYTNAFPKIVWTKDSVPTSETILGAIVACSNGMYAHGQFWARITFKQRFKA